MSEGQVIFFVREKPHQSGQWRGNLTFQNRCVHGVGDDRCLYMWHGVYSEQEDLHTLLDRPARRILDTSRIVSRHEAH